MKKYIVAILVVILSFIYIIHKSSPVDGMDCLLQMQNNTEINVIYNTPLGDYLVPAKKTIIMDDIQEIPYPFITNIIDQKTKKTLASVGMGYAEENDIRLPTKKVCI